MNKILSKLSFRLTLAYPLLLAALPFAATGAEYSLALVQNSDQPLIDRANPGSVGIGHGFEGGRVFMHRGEFHMFVTEEPTGWDQTRTAHWKSKDGVQWQRISTINASGTATNDPRHAIWSGMPFYNPEERRWNLFYVGYERDGTYHGRVFRACSAKPGEGGLDGPYVDVPDALMSYTDAVKHPWEGDQGADSFYPYRCGKKWMTLYGSAGSPYKWCVGLAFADKLAGPWMRGTNPAPTLTFAENPIVSQFDDGTFFCVYDYLAHGTANCHTIGYAYSHDGTNWTSKFLEIPMPPWANNVRTPQSFIRAKGDEYWIYFTANTPSHFDCAGRLKVRLVKAQPTTN